MTNPLAVILERLKAADCRPKKTKRGWVAFCPVHESPPKGHRRSLYITTGRNGAPVLTCRGACPTKKVLAALGMTLANLYPDNPRRKKPPAVGQRTPQRTDALSDSAPMRPLEDPEYPSALGKGTTVGEEGPSLPAAVAVVVPGWAVLARGFQSKVSNATLASFAKEFGVSWGSLRGLGIGYDRSKDMLTFPMWDGAGHVVGLRYRPRKDPHRKYTAEGGRLGLFLPAGLAAGQVEVVAEGETDAAAALTRGVDAIGLPGAGQGLDDLAEFLRQSPVPCPCIVGDSDGAGQAGADGAADTLLAAGVPCRVLIPSGPHRDLRDWFNAGGLTAADLRRAIRPASIRFPDASANWTPGFSQIPNQFIRRCLEMLGPEGLAWAVLFRSFDAGDGEVFPAREKLAEITGKSVATVDRWKNELHEAGVLRWTRGWKGRCNEYSIDLGPCKELKTRRRPTPQEPRKSPPAGATTETDGREPGPAGDDAPGGTVRSLGGILAGDGEVCERSRP